MNRRVTHLVVHHNGVPGRTIEHIRRTHKANGWRDIGYHFVYHEDGSEHVGRKLSQAGAHTSKMNARTVGLCVIGNGNQKDFNPAQYDALVSRLVVLCKLYGLEADAVIGHRETPKYGAAPTKKTCPGSKVDLDKLRARVAVLLVKSRSPL